MFFAKKCSKVVFVPSPISIFAKFRLLYLFIYALIFKTFFTVNSSIIQGIFYKKGYSTNKCLIRICVDSCVPYVKRFIYDKCVLCIVSLYNFCPYDDLYECWHPCPCLLVLLVHARDLKTRLRGRLTLTFLNPQFASALRLWQSLRLYIIESVAILSLFIQ